MPTYAPIDAALPLDLWPYRDKIVGTWESCRRQYRVAGMENVYWPAAVERCRNEVNIIIEYRAKVQAFYAAVQTADIVGSTPTLPEPRYKFQQRHADGGLVPRPRHYADDGAPIKRPSTPTVALRPDAESIKRLIQVIAARRQSLINESKRPWTDRRWFWWVNQGRALLTKLRREA